MTDPKPNQIWRHIRGSHVVVTFVDDEAGMWACPSDSDGFILGASMPVDSFHGPLWTHVGEVAR